MLMMFGVGLHFSIRDLIAVQRNAIPGAIVQIAAATALAALTARVWGWDLAASLVGNPSDGYYGKTISFIVRNYSAEVALWESPDLEILPAARDHSAFRSLEDPRRDVTGVELDPAREPAERRARLDQHDRAAALRQTRRRREPVGPAADHDRVEALRHRLRPSAFRAGPARRARRARP